MKGAWVGGLAVALFAIGGLLVVLSSRPAGRGAPAETPRGEIPAGEVPTGETPAGETPSIAERAAQPGPLPPPPVVSGPRVVHGHAVGRYGPIWGVRVTARDTASAAPLAQVATDRAGAYRIDLTEYDARVVDLIAERDVGEGVLVLERRGLAWDAPGEVAVDFRWATPGSTCGQVFDLTPLRFPVGVVALEAPGPRPAGPVRLFAVPESAYRRAFGPEEIHPALLSRVPKETVLTDDIGRFEFVGLPGGRYRVVSGQADRMCAAPVECDAGSGDVVVELVECVTAAVYPYDAITDRPLRDARLVAERGEDRYVATGGGTALWLRVPARHTPGFARTSFRVEADGYRPVDVAMVGTSAQRVYLLPDVAPNGEVVVRYDDGSPLGHAIDVRFSGSEGGRWQDQELGRGSGGRLEAGLPPGSWEVVVSLVDFPVDVLPVRRTIEVGPDAGWSLHLTVERGGDIQLTPPEVEGAGDDGRLLPGSYARFTRLSPESEAAPADFELPSRWRCDLTGATTTVEMMRPGHYEVYLMGRGLYAEVTVLPGGTSAVRDWVRR